MPGNVTNAPDNNCARVFNQSTVDVFNFITFFLSVTASIVSVVYTVYTCCNRRIKITEDTHTKVHFSKDGSVESIDVDVHSTAQRHPHEALVDLRRKPPETIIVEQVMEFSKIQKDKYINTLFDSFRKSITDPELNTREALSNRFSEIIKQYEVTNYDAVCMGRNSPTADAEA